MSWYEYSLLVIFALTVGVSAYTDLRYGKIKNVILAIALLLSVPVQTIACITEHIKFTSLGISVLAVVVFSIIFYLLGFWAAGDCKLLITIATTFPYTLYWNLSTPLMKALSLVLFFLAVTYSYIILDTILNIITNLETFLLTCKKITTKHSVSEFIKKWCVIVAITNILYYINEFFGGWLRVSVVLTGFFVFLVLNSLIEKLQKIWFVFLALNIVYWILSHSTVSEIIYKIIFAIIIFGLCRMVGVFNYKIIPTEKLQSGMILSIVSIKEILRQQKIDFLDEKMAENMTSRLSKDEVDIIKSTGIDMVRIVRKFPFAVFIFISCVLYLIMERYYAI